jgi:hypothetical protein
MDQGPLQRHLRRSLSLRSLKFLQGLPQVSSRSGGTSAAQAWFTLIAAPHEAGAGRRREFQLCLFLLAFRRDVALHKHNHSPRELMSTNPVHHRVILLIFAAGLIALFRFVSTVTILQHAIRRSPPVRGGHSVAASNPPANAERIAGLAPAKELGKGWRFFPTYAEVQTSPVLRHSIPRTRDHEC